MSDVYSGPVCGGVLLDAETVGMRPKLIAIVGGSGSGKSWLSNQLCDRLKSQAAQISLDDFYQDRSHLPPTRRARLNFDHPSAIDWDLFAETITQCRGGLPFSVPHYDFRTHSRRADCIQKDARPAVLIEGLWLLRRPSLRRLFDLTIYVECPDELRRRRRMERDTVERQRTEFSVGEQWRQTVLPMHWQFVIQQAQWADLTVVSPVSDEEMDRLVDRIQGLLLEPV